MNDVMRVCALLAVVFLTAASLCAQSLDPSKPTPVRSNTVDASIAARDLGDARLTDHYYAFTGTPGDLLITVQSQNLNGDIDVFTAGTLRPLLKLTLYAEISSATTKSIYLRKREDLVLRIEARTPNDAEGTYRVVFGGSFEPIVGGPDIAENETPTPKVETPTTGRRVSSVGARIEEPARPATEVATATPEPIPETTPEAKPVESPKPEEAKRTETTENVRPAPRRNPRTRPSTPRAQPPRATETVQPAVEESKPEPPRTEAPKTEPEPEPEIGPRLVIETRDGTLINRAMSGVRRVTVERGQVVVVGTDGKIDRILLADVVRMTIAP
jgi:hypothetical protein